ncbi:MAG: hypothetical protein ACE5JL_15485, partial [Dehalococcoidia bacterium]
ELVAGTLDTQQLDLALAALPLGVGREYTIPVFSAQEGGLRQAQAKVLAEDQVTVPAGTYQGVTVEVRVGPQLVTYFFAREPRGLLVRQEIPAQQVVIELTGVADVSQSRE